METQDIEEDMETQDIVTCIEGMEMQDMPTFRRHMSDVQAAKEQ